NRYGQTLTLAFLPYFVTPCSSSALPSAARLPRPKTHEERALPPLLRGYWAQSWDVNSSESRTWKVGFISSNDLPESGPEKLKSQAHSEQPHPAKLCPS